MFFCLIGRFVVQALQARSRWLRDGTRKTPSAAAPARKSAPEKGASRRAAPEPSLEEFLIARGHPGAKVKI